MNGFGSKVSRPEFVCKWVRCPTGLGLLERQLFPLGLWEAVHLDQDALKSLDAIKQLGIQTHLAAGLLKTDAPTPLVVLCIALEFSRLPSRSVQF